MHLSETLVKLLYDAHFAYYFDQSKQLKHFYTGNMKCQCHMYHIILQNFCIIHYMFSTCLSVTMDDSVSWYNRMSPHSSMVKVLLNIPTGLLFVSQLLPLANMTQLRQECTVMMEGRSDRQTRHSYDSGVNLPSSENCECRSKCLSMQTN